MHNQRCICNLCKWINIVWLNRMQLWWVLKCKLKRSSFKEQLKRTTIRTQTLRTLIEQICGRHAALHMRASLRISRGLFSSNIFVSSFFIIIFLFFPYIFRLRKEKLEENQQQNENEKQRTSRNATPNDDASVLNLSKNKRERSNTPESHREGSPEVEHVADDASDMELSESSMHSRSPSSPPNLNAKLNFHQRDFPRPPPITFPSTEILLRNIQELLKVVLENSIQQEQQMNFEKGNFKSLILQWQRTREKWQFCNFQF